MTGATATMLGALILTNSGCIVPQGKGKGNASRLVEPSTNTGYWLYLPEEYVRSGGQHPQGGRWPLVVTFHGAKPYDNAHPQIREWQQEADRYGYVVIAPELRTSDSFMQYPLKDPTLSYVQHDERAVMAIMDEVFRRTNADPARVLATSWSAGGYMAHFMVNRHPERFACLAVKQSNFSEALLDPIQVVRYADMPVAIFFGENDFPACRTESEAAVRWYRLHGFNVVAKRIRGLGHERTPQTAAAFFADALGSSPRTPPDMGKFVMEDVIIDGVANYQRRPDRRTVPPPPPPGSMNTAGATGQPPHGNVVFSNGGTTNKASAGSESSPAWTRVAPAAPVERSPRAIPTSPPMTPTPRRPLAQPYTSEPTSPAPPPDRPALPPKPAGPDADTPRLKRLGSLQGQAPLTVHFTVELPTRWREGSSILWTDNGKPFATSQFSARSVMREPGVHVIEARIVTPDDRRLVLTERLTVDPPTSQPASS